MLDIKKLTNKIPLMLAALFSAASVATVIYYIIYPSAAFFHYDCADTILWAQASYDAKALFNPDFGYAAMLPFGGAMLMAPFIGIFGVSMTTHHIGMVIFALLMFAAVWFLFRSLKFSHSASLAAVGFTAMILCSGTKLREMFFEHSIYYSISVVIICVLLSLLLRLKESYDNDSIKKFVFLAACIIVFSVCSALDGMQVISMSIVPVIFAAAAEVILNKEDKIFSDRNKFSLYFCFICGGSAIIGLWILLLCSKDVSAGYANAYTSYSNMDQWLENLGKFPAHWFSLFGVDAEYGKSIFSLHSIINLIRIASAAIIAVVPLIALFFYKKFDFGSKILILTHFGTSAVIMFGYVFGLLSAAGWRLSPMVCTGLFVCLAAFRTAKNYILPMRFSVIALCVLLLMSGISFVSIAKMEKNGIAENPKYQLAVLLEERGLKNGFASFWNAHAITVLSDSEITVRNIDIKEEGIIKAKYQTNKSWYENDGETEEYFVLLTSEEIHTFQNTDEWECFEAMAKDSYEIAEGYHIFTFDSTFFLD